MYTLKEAAEAAGKGKPAILKAIKNGRVSAKKDAKGQWSIDPAELHRVYPPITGTSSENGSGKRQEILKETIGNSVLEREIELLRERLADKDKVIDYLQRNLDEEKEERRKLTLMLTDQRENAPNRPTGGFMQKFGRMIAGDN
jgi:hypothetical protein